MTTTIKDTDLFVVQSGTNSEICNYTGAQLREDINLLLAERDVKVWVQATPPPTPLAPDYASKKDLWYDTSIGAFFIGALDANSEVVWIIVNPTDHRKFLDSTSGEVTFPHGTYHGETFEHPNGVTYHFRSAKSQWMDKDLPGLDTFVLREGDTMTGALQLPNLIVTGDDTVEAHIELNDGLLTADDTVVGEEQRLYWNGDTVAKHEDVVTLTNTVVNIDQHIENITPYTYRGLLRFGSVNEDEKYVLYDGPGGTGDTVTVLEDAVSVFLSSEAVSVDVPDMTLITKGMYLEIQATSGTNLLTGKISDKSVLSNGAILDIDTRRSQGTSVVGDISHIRIFSVADSSAKAGVYYQKTAPSEAADDNLQEGQLWVDSKTNLQYIWTGKEWSEVGAACGGGSGGAEIPIGVIWPYAGEINNSDGNLETDAPAGWLLCNGDKFDGDKYPLLKELLKTDQVPNLKGRYLGGSGDPGSNSNTATYYGIGRPRTFLNDYTRRPRNSNWNSNNNNPINVNSSDISHTHGISNVTGSTDDNNTSNHHHSWSGYKSNSGGSGKNHNDPDRPFSVASNENNWQKFNKSENDSWLGGGKHNHNVKVNGTTDSGGSKTHSHNVSVASFDTYTRPFTYAVNWIIKHD